MSPRWVAASAAHRRCGDAVLLGTQDRDRHLRLNGPAASVWLRLAGGPATESELGGVLLAPDGVRAVLSELERVGAVRVETDGDADRGDASTARRRPPALPGGGTAERRALCAGLPRAGSAEPLVLDTVAGQALVERARREAIVPPLAEAVRAGELILPPGPTGALDEALELAQGQALRIELSAAEAVETLERAGIESLVIKGLATAHLDHPDPSWRQMVDVDLLVHPDRLGPAIEALCAAGGRPPRPYRLSPITKSVAITLPGGVEVDVHRVPARLPYGAVAMEPELMGESTTWIDLAGRRCRALQTPDRFALAVAHYALSDVASRKWSSLQDALALWPTIGEADEWRGALERWRAEVLFEIVLGELASLDVRPATLSGDRTPNARWYERSLAHRGLPGVVDEYLAPFVVTPFRQWPAAAGALLMPGDEHMTASPHRSQLQRVGSALARLAPEVSASVRGRRGSAVGPDPARVAERRLAVVTARPKRNIRALEDVPPDQVVTTPVATRTEPPSCDGSDPVDRWYPQFERGFLLCLDDAYVGDNVVFDADHYYGLGRWWLGERHDSWRLYENVTEIRHVEKAISLTAWGGEAFQHFVVDVLPRLGVLFSILDDPRFGDLRLVSHWDDAPAARWFWDALGLADRVEPKPKNARADFVIHADEVLFADWEPRSRHYGLHPRGSLRPVQQRLGVLDGPDPDLVLYLDRAGRTRNVTNAEVVLEAVAEEVWIRGLSLEVFESEGDLDADRALFERARLVLGPHGGGFANLVFARPGTHVVEFSPVCRLFERGEDPRACYWGLAQAGGQHYWSVEPEGFDFGGRDMSVDPAVVAAVVARALDTDR